MTRPTLAPRWAVITAWIVVALAPSTRADRLHLEGGGLIDVDRWWIEGDTLVYDAAGGTMGIPRSIVARIETTNRERSARRSDPPPTAPPAGRPTLVLDASDDAELRDLMRRGRQALEAREFESASAYFLRVVEDRPEIYAARVGYVVSEIEMQHHGLALSVVLDGIAREPTRPELYALLGELRYRDERLEDALVALRQAFEIEPSDDLRERILKVERELEASRFYDFASSSHFNLRYDGEVDPSLADAMIDYLETQYWVITESLRHAPPRPITVQLFPLQQFREVTRAPDWAGGLYDGKIRVPLGGLTRLTPDAQRVLVHELTHAVVHSKSRGNAPRWLHEGLAQRSEGRTLLRADRQAIAAELRAFPPERWATLEFSYPLALSMTEFLESLAGFAGLVQLIDEMGQGAAQDEALQRVYGRDYDRLCLEWGRQLLEREG
ncbi:MAG TPA: hypothetical protein VD788_02745 [Candidatus Polarisedimenticolaceae bacterium]|nr:hypothetical protein [Candidatus Polarisedimenticolaceae bacterium]